MSTVDLSDDGLRHLVAGAVAGFTATTALHPLDLIKTRLHVQESGARRLPQYTSLPHAVRSIAQSEGLRGFYGGIGPNLFGSTAAWAMYMHLYERTKAALAARTQLGDSAIYLASASIAGAAVSLVLHPVFTIKTRLQLQLAARPDAKLGPDVIPAAARDNYTGGLNAALRMLREEGLLSVYRGIGPSLVLVSHGAVQFLAYEKCKIFLHGWNASRSAARADATLPSAQLAFAATGSKVLATMVTYPYQVVRSCMQQRASVGGDAIGRHFSSTSETFLHLWRIDGLRAFYRGLVPHILRSTPSGSITLVVYEYLLKLLPPKAASSDS